MTEEFVDLDLQLLLADYGLLESWDHPNLSAPYWRLYHAEGPGAAINIMGTEVPLEPDLLYLLPPDTPYASHLEQPVGLFYLYFMTPAEHHCAQPTAYAFPAGEELREHAEEACVMMDEGVERAVLTAHLQALAYAGLSRVPEDRFLMGYADERVQQAVDYMEEHFGRSLTRQEMAMQANMNTEAFVELFRETTGEGPLEYYMRRRIETACLLLHFSEMSIDRIAAETGFSDRHHLAREFEPRRGLRPEEFRPLKTPNG